MYVWIIIVAVAFAAGIGMGYVSFQQSTHFNYMMMNQQQMRDMMGDPQQMAMWQQTMMSDPKVMSQWMSNPQTMNQWMETMMSNSQLQQQMYQNMFSNQQFMQGMMNNPQFQNQWMGKTIGNGTALQDHMGTGMMGNMMGSTAEDTSYKTISIQDAINEMSIPQDDVQVNKKDNTITFNSLNVNITPFAMMRSDAMNAIDIVPSSSDDTQGDAFVIDEMINPTLVVKSGTLLHVTVVNLDEDMGHNFVITTLSPSYSLMPMQGMMNDNAVFLNSMPIIPNEKQQEGYAYEFTTALTLEKSGTYWYICTYPGHAAEGMYGKIIVQ